MLQMTFLIKKRGLIAGYVATLAAIMEENPVDRQRERNETHNSGTTAARGGGGSSLTRSQVGMQSGSEA